MKVAADRSSLARPGNAADLGGNWANHYLSEGCTNLETKVGDAFGDGQPRKRNPALALERVGLKPVIHAQWRSGDRSQLKIQYRRHNQGFPARQPIVGAANPRT
jgi:hypothetical protein